MYSVVVKMVVVEVGMEMRCSRRLWRYAAGACPWWWWSWGPVVRVDVQEVGGAARAAAPVDLQEVVVVARVVVVVGVEVVATVVGLW